MKMNLLKSICYCLFVVLLTSSSCSHDDDDNSSDDDQAQISANLNVGTWRITNFIDSGNNETSNFSNFNFTFAENSVLIATNGTETYTGSWNITSSSGSDDDGSSSNDLDLNIFFNLTNEFEDLNEDWDFVTQNSIKIELIHISGGNGGTDNLTFERN